MTKATSRTSTATRRSSGTDKSEPNGHAPPDEQDSRREQVLMVERDDRDARDEQDEQRQTSGRGDKRLRREQDLADERDERRPRDEHDQQDEDFQHGEQGWRRDARRQPDGVQRNGVGPNGDQREQRTDRVNPATSTVVDALEPVLVAWQQVFTSWFELAGTMVKLQQQTFASMIGAADTNTERITNGDHLGRHDAISTSGTTSVAPNQIEHDRRSTGERDEDQSRPGVQRGRQPASRVGVLNG